MSHGDAKERHVVASVLAGVILVVTDATTGPGGSALRLMTARSLRSLCHGRWHIDANGVSDLTHHSQPLPGRAARFGPLSRYRRVFPPLLLILSTALALLAPSGCKRAETSGPTEEGGVSQRTTITIGAILPLTGSGAEFGKDELIGAQIARDRINAGSGDVKVELIVEDSRTDASAGVAAYRKLMASRPRPVALITVMSSVSSAIAPLVERDRIPLFCVAAAPSLTAGRHFVFRALPTSDYQARNLLDRSSVHTSFDSVAILYVTDDFGTAMRHSFRAAATTHNVTVLHSEGVSSDSTDFRPSLLRVINSKPDAVYIAAFGSVLGSAVRQLRELGYGGFLLTTLEIGYPKVLEVAGQAAEGALFVDTKFDPDSAEAETKNFVDAFRQRTGRAPSLDAVLAYDEIQLLFLAGSKRGFGPDAIAEGLLEIDDYQSINGRATVRANGDVEYELVLKTIRNGRPLVISEDR